MKTLKQLLQELDACGAARYWASETPIEEVVSTCHRGDWLLWLAARAGVDNRKLVLAAGLCANTVRDKMKDERSIKAVDACIDYGYGRIERGAVIDAASAAYDAADAYAADAYAADAYDAAYTYAAYVAADAAYAVDAAADAAYDAAAAANSETESRKQTADICREVFGEQLIILVNERLSE